MLYCSILLHVTCHFSFTISHACDMVNKKWQMDIRALSLGVMRLECNADCRPPSSAEVKNTRSYTSTFSYIFTAQYLIKQVQLYFYLRLVQFHIMYVMFMFGFVSIKKKRNVT